MKLEQQVTSLEISKKLKELGFKQESLFGWRKNTNLGDSGNGQYVIWSFGTPEKFIGDESYSAFTVSELADLQKEVRGYPEPWWDNGWYYHDGVNRINKKAETQVDAYGMTLISMTEKHLIDYINSGDYKK